MIACLRSPTTSVGTPACASSHSSANCSGFVSWNSSTTRQSTRLASVWRTPAARAAAGARARSCRVVDEAGLALGRGVLHEHVLAGREQRLDVARGVLERPGWRGSAPAACITAAARLS
jgi:hypothetical protein